MLNKKLLRILCVSLIFTLFSPFFNLSAQGSAFVANEQRMAILPGNVKNVSFVDGELYCYASGVMLKAQRSGEQLLGFWADTDYVRLEEGARLRSRCRTNAFRLSQALELPVVMVPCNPMAMTQPQ